MELKHYFSILWRWGWLIVLATLLAAALSYQVTLQLPRIYSSTATVMVGQFLQSENPNAADFTTSQQLAQTYSLVVRRQPLLQATVDALGLNTPWQVLAQQVSAAALPQSQLLQITVVDTSPERARAIADEVAHQLILQSPTPSEKEADTRQQFVTEQLSLLQGRINDAEDQQKSLESRLALETTARGVGDVQSQISALQQKISTWQSTYASLLNQKVGRVNNLSIVEPANISLVPVSPNPPLNVLIAALIGMSLSIGAILILDYLDDTFKSSEDIEQALDVVALGSIGRLRRRPRSFEDGLVTVRHRQSSLAEAYRMLRTNLQFASMRLSARVLVVTSAVVGEGKTSTACNLAVTMAQAGMRVILCDGDLRRPSVHRMFGVGNEVGLTSLLLDPALPPDDVLIETAIPNLALIASGPVPANPAEVLGSEQMRERIAELRHLADVVLIDAAAVLPIADATLIGALTDGVVLVVDSAHTRRETVKRAHEHLHRVGLRVLGVVLNKSQAAGGQERRYHLNRLTADGGRPLRRRLGLTALWSGLFGGR